MFDLKHSFSIETIWNLGSRCTSKSLWCVNCSNYTPKSSCFHWIFLELWHGYRPIQKGKFDSLRHGNEYAFSRHFNLYLLFFRLDRKCWSKFWWSSCSIHSVFCSSIWFSNILRCRTRHLCGFFISFIDRSKSPLASNHLFPSLRFWQCGNIYSRYISLRSLLSRWSTSQAYSCHVYHFDWFSHRVSHHECLHLFLNRR